MYLSDILFKIFYNKGLLSRQGGAEQHACDLGAHGAREPRSPGHADTLGHRVTRPASLLSRIAQLVLISKLLDFTFGRYVVTF